MRFKSLYILLLLVLPAFVYSQEETITSLDEIIEEIASSSDVELDYTTLFQSLEELYYNPLDLNTTTEDGFKDLIFLTEFQIYSLVKYRKKFGDYKTVYELQFVDGIDVMTLKRILPFVTIRTGPQKQTNDLSKLFGYGKHTGLVRY